MFHRGVTKFSIDVDQLPNGSTLYYPGDSITGTLNLSVTAVPIKFHHLYIVMEGKAKVKTNQPAEAILCNYISHLLVPSSSGDNNIIDDVTVPTDLDGKIQKKKLPTGLLPVGDHTFPFSFNIPLDAPASISTGDTRGALEVKYLLKATLVRGEGLTNNNVDKKMFRVSSVMSEEQYVVERSYTSQFPATLPMNALVGSNGVIEAKATMEGGRVLTLLSSSQATQQQAPSPISLSVEVDNCSRKAVEGASVELQLVTQVDHYGNGYNSSHESFKQDREGDLRFCNSLRTLVPVPSSKVKSALQIQGSREEHENCGMGTASDGYVVKNNTAIHFGSHVRTLKVYQMPLLASGAQSSSTVVPTGGKGTYKIDLSPLASAHSIPLPTLRCDRIQINYRLLIRLKGVAKSICLPIVVVNDVISTEEQKREGFQLPWFHHEKIFTSVKSGEYKKEVPAPSPVAGGDGEENIVTGVLVVQSDQHHVAAGSSSEGEYISSSSASENDEDDQIADHYRRLGYQADHAATRPPAIEEQVALLFSNRATTTTQQTMPAAAVIPSTQEKVAAQPSPTAETVVHDRTLDNQLILKHYQHLGYAAPAAKQRIFGSTPSAPQQQHNQPSSSSSMQLPGVAAQEEEELSNPSPFAQLPSVSQPPVTAMYPDLPPPTYSQSMLQRAH